MSFRPDDLPPPSTTHALTAGLVGAEGVLPVDVELSYDPTCPYAVTARFTTELGTVGWTFGRDLLRHGLYKPVGRGDVQVRPDLDDEGHAAVCIELFSPQGKATILAPSVEVFQFVQGTVATVWPGTESAHLDIDAAIDAVLVSATDD